MISCYDFGYSRIGISNLISTMEDDKYVQVDEKTIILQSNSSEMQPRLTPTGKISYAKTRVYTQRYRKEWEFMTDFKGIFFNYIFQRTLYFFSVGLEFIIFEFFFSPTNGCIRVSAEVRKQSQKNPCRRIFSRHIRSH